MLWASFKVQYLSLINTFGGENFNRTNAEKVWLEVKDLPEKEAVGVFEWMHKNYSIKKPPTHEDLIKKIKGAIFVEKQRQENLKSGQHNRDVKSPDGLDGLQRELKRMGFSSVQELLASFGQNRKK